MAFPKGLPRDLYTTMKADGRLPDWLAKHKVHSEAGTLEEWLKEQGLSLAPSGSKPEAPKAAPKRFKTALEEILLQAQAFISTLHDASFAGLTADDIMELAAVQEHLSEVRSQAKRTMDALAPIAERFEREADLLAELENEQLKVAEALEENERLKAQILAMEQTLVANGHSDKVTKGKGKAVPTLVS